ncbi:hypothetical protein, partial [Xanthovirga aplysinae]|uniref:hypothetical protein n=1 Tax=Xanthovirga aplysinae TaxID=2529853 RepID=UPI001656E455
MNLSEKINFINHQFGKIIPDKAEKILTLVLLQEWISLGKIESKFSEFDVVRAFEEVVEMTGREKNIAVQRPIRDLRRFYLLYFRKEDKYKLSQYAESFIHLLNEEIYKNYNPESLK